MNLTLRAEGYLRKEDVDLAAQVFPKKPVDAGCE